MAALQPRQCPPKRGLRFATNAAMPSRASSVPYSTAPTAGSLLAGVGLMISVYRPHRDEAAGYALHVAAAATQRSTCLAAGGQPAHHDVWADPAADGASGGFCWASSGSGQDDRAVR